MMNLRESIQATHDYLDGHFQTTENGNLTINIPYFLDSVGLAIDNTKWINEAILRDRRTKIEGLVFAGIIELCNMELKHDGFKASNYHIKKWFEKYGLDYKEVLAPLVKENKEYREEQIALREKEV